MSTSGLREQASEALRPFLDRCPADLAGQRLRAELLLTLSNQERQLGRVAEAEALARASLALAEQLGDAVQRGRAMGAIGSALDQGGDLSGQGLMMSADAVAILRSVGAELLAATYECNLGVRLYSQGQLEEAEALLWRCRTTLRLADRTLDAAFADVNLGVVRLAQGQAASALALALGVLPIFSAAADHPGECYARLLEGRARCMQGELALADAALERCCALAERQRLLKLYAHALRYRAWVAAMQGRPEALRLAEESQEGLFALGHPESVSLREWTGWLRAGPEAPSARPRPEGASNRVDDRLGQILFARLTADRAGR